MSEERFASGELILRTGVYRVEHPQHLLPQEVTLEGGANFPGCAACDEPVAFELLRQVDTRAGTGGFRVALFRLPVLEIHEKEDGEATPEAGVA